MPTLADTDIGDLVTGTLNELGRGRFNEVATDLQNYEFFKRMMRKERVKFDDGTGIQRTIMIDHSGAARNIGLFGQDTVNVGDVLIQMDIPWRHTETHFAYDKRELMMNAGVSRIVDLIKVRRTDAIISLAERMEQDAWNKPADSTDKLQPFGLPYWLVSSTTQGFNGTNPSGFTSGAGNISSTTYPRWANYTDQFANVTKDDLIDKMRRAYAEIRFMSPVDVPDFRRGRGDQFRIYTNLDVLLAFERIGEAQNENLGRDLAPMDGTIAFRRNPIVRVPYLDDDPVETDPVYMINHKWFYPVFLRGDYMRKTGPTQASNNHNVLQCHFDNTWNLLCTNRRENAVIVGGG